MSVTKRFGVFKPSQNDSSVDKAPPAGLEDLTDITGLPVPPLSLLLSNSSCLPVCLTLSPDSLTEVSARCLLTGRELPLLVSSRTSFDGHLDTVVGRCSSGRPIRTFAVWRWRVEGSEVTILGLCVRACLSQASRTAVSRT